MSTEGSSMTMRIKVIVPSGVLAEQQAAKLVAEASDGSFCLLPRHVDFVAVLVPGILTLTSADGEETFFAVDEGLLVKHGTDVRVSTWNALQGKLGELQQAVLAQFREQGEQEQQARHALDRLEASLVQQVLDWDGRRHA
ncbi:MAG: F0F1 ATP synthase subunit epsilon [Candidatus Cloacimonetes bacterium]|nr:F0F1 ATP synthase subunit epsilon [Candidatus Cloacimonadota bacterium]